MKTLPKKCDVCSDKIGLYQPFYTVETEGRFTGRKNDLKKRIAVLCPGCFRSYEQFLQSREEYFIYSNAKKI